MRVFAFLNGLFDGVNPAFLVAVGFVLLALDFLIAFRVGREAVYTALALFSGGICFLPAIFSVKFSDGDTAVFGILLLVFGAFFYLCLAVAFRVRERRRARRASREKESRQAMFTLPDKENTFVRDRLNTSLRANEEGKEDEEDYDLEESKLRLNHVRDMLSKLKAAPLSPGDRLETEGISRQITIYATKNKLTAKELRGLNDCLSMVLKMTAKYAV